MRLEGAKSNLRSLKKRDKKKEVTFVSHGRSLGGPWEVLESSLGILGESLGRLGGGKGRTGALKGTTTILRSRERWVRGGYVWGGVPGLALS